MKTAAAVLCLCLAFVSCTTAPASKPNPLLPWNWFKGDPQAKIVKYQEHMEDAKLGLIKISQELYDATMLELESDPSPSANVIRAKLYLRRGNEDLANAVGPIAPDRQRATEQMVQQRASEDPKERAAGDKALALLDKQSALHASEIFELQQKLTDAHADEAKALARARIAEEKWDRMWFWIWTFVAGYVVVQIAPLALRLFPALAPVTHAAEWIAAPALKASYSRLRTGVVDVIHTAKSAGQIGVDALTNMLDAPIDVHEQKTISNAVKSK